ncbi:glycoside hydrolase family 13 protein [Caldicellulosiruptor naganoensis]|uniref:Glycoside hydrolase family 13 protein n=1 Tax=Caldicellulosiruptor naganoensis TaxID=29324 RepID=A0ABY7BGB4_9FIRM|nr:glycoside hydrolase family 13 protein [Caldicellulosiruptor naganoensis]WAM31849.1 glycoside hydrolase family 13 protein [Caldicellulosiruptor naganoensis]
MEIIHNQLHDIFALEREKFLIRLWIRKGFAKEIYLIFSDRYEIERIQKLKMDYYMEVGEYEVYQAIVEASTPRLGYKFMVKLFDGTFKIYDQFGLQEDDEEIYVGHFHFPYANPSDVFEKPKWVEKLVVYEIFPDRFARKDKKEEPRELYPWDYCKWEKPGGEVFLGGNFEGIKSKIDYFKRLGINAIYFTPIFKSTSSHRYNVDDYFDVDPLLGTKEEFKELVETLHQNGIKVILDMVFNHTGTGFFAFQDVIKNGMDSKYFNWYNIKSLPVDIQKGNYETFATGVKSMPRIDTSKKDVQDFFLSVLKYWLLEFDVDGFRFDVANELDKSFLRRIRLELKTLKKDVLLIGEVMHRSESFLLGDMFDGVMNYFSWEVFLRFLLGKYKAKDAVKILAEYRLKFNPKLFSCQLNLIGSHDTKRVLNAVLKNKKLAMLACVYNLTYQGIPMIYYGDEIGMEGEHDPDCRRGMIWEEEKWDKEIFELYRKLISLKKTSTALNVDDVKEGFLGDVMYFERKADDEMVCIFFNPGKSLQNIKLFTPEIVGKEITFFKSGKSVKNFSATFEFEILPEDFEILIVR